MKKVYVSIKNENGQTLPIGDLETFGIFLTECPIVGDHISISEIYDDSDIISKDDQIRYLYEFCKEELPYNGRSPSFVFKVIERTIFRISNKSWLCLDLQHQP